MSHTTSRTPLLAAALSLLPHPDARAQAPNKASLMLKRARKRQADPAQIRHGYFSLVPGETKRVTIQFDPPDAGPAPPRLVVECWNNAARSFPPAQARTADLALSRPAASSSDDEYSGGAGAALDGDPLTRWSSAWGADPQWLRVDLGGSEPIRRVKLAWEAAYATGYQVQVSDDGIHWTDIYRTASGQGGVVDFSGLSGRGHYVRLYATERATRFGYSLYDFEVYGPAAAAAE